MPYDPLLDPLNAPSYVTSIMATPGPIDVPRWGDEQTAAPLQLSQPVAFQPKLSIGSVMQGYQKPVDPSTQTGTGVPPSASSGGGSGGYSPSQSTSGGTSSGTSGSTSSLGGSFGGSRSGNWTPSAYSYHGKTGTAGTKTNLLYGWQPAMVNAWTKATTEMRANGISVPRVNEGWRSYETQLKYWNDPSIGVKAHPGNSVHGIGYAGDLNITDPRQRAILAKNGIVNPLSNDPGHYQLRPGLMSAPVAAPGGQRPSFVPQSDWNKTVSAATSQGVDPNLMAAIGQHETGWGTLGAGKPDRGGYIFGYGYPGPGRGNPKYAGVDNQIDALSGRLAEFQTTNGPIDTYDKLLKFATDEYQPAGNGGPAGWAQSIWGTYGGLGPYRPGSPPPASLLPAGMQPQRPAAGQMPASGMENNDPNANFIAAAHPENPINTLDPEMQKALVIANTAMKAAGYGEFGVTSGQRSVPQQNGLIAGGNPNVVQPQDSTHVMTPYAADLDFKNPAQQGWFYKNAARFGIVLPAYRKEPWHAELAPVLRKQVAGASHQVLAAEQRNVHEEQSIQRQAPPVKVNARRAKPGSQQLI